MRRVVNCCWFVFKWGFALLVIAALSMGGYLYFCLDEEIRKYAEGALAEQYGDLDIAVGGARFVPGRGVEVFNVSLADPDAHRPLLEIDELSIEGRFELQQLMEGRPDIDRVVVRRPRLLVRRLADGGWCFEPLLQVSPNGGDAPPVEIVDATLTLEDESKPTAKPIVIRNVDLKVKRLAPSEEGPSGAYRFEASIEGSIAQRLQASGWIDPATGGFDVTANAERLQINHELLASAPMAPGDALRGLHLRAVASAQVTLNSAGRGAACNWAGAIAVSDAVVDHPVLPRPLTDLRVAASANAEGLAVRSLTARCGVAEITAACNRRGWGAAAPIALRGRVTDLPLDDKLRSALPGRMQKLWQRFRPQGVVDVNGMVAFDGVHWKPDVTVDCRDLSVEDSEKFPYRMTGASGAVRYFGSGAPSKGRLELKLQGLAEGRAVALGAEFYGLPCIGEREQASPPGGRPPCPVGWVSVYAPQLRVSEKMIAALRPHPDALKIARALSPAGDFGVSWRMERRSEEQWEPVVNIDIEAIDCSINYDRFPYPLEHIKGRLRSRDNEWTFEELESRERNGPRVVTASGGLKSENGRKVFRMRLQAVAAQLDEALRNALPGEQQEIWKELRPAGRVSFTTDIAYALGDAEPSLAIALAPHERSVSLEPTFFQYRLERVDGRFYLQGGKVWFTGARAEHGRTRIASDGFWAPDSAGGWRFQLDRLHVDYLDADHDLRLAAPIGLRRVIDQLQPEGSFGIHGGRLGFTYAPLANGRVNRGVESYGGLKADWDLHLDCHQADVTLGVLIEGVTGDVHLWGASDEKDCQAFGELNLDSLFWNGMQLTNIRGPLWASPEECRLGEGAGEKEPRLRKAKITADAYGGGLELNARALYSNRTQYGMAITLNKVDFARYSRDYLEAETPLAGKLNGALNLRGEGNSIYGLEGDGSMSLSEADLYQLPVMVSLLKVLSVRAPDTKAFDGCDAEFTMQGQHLQFSRLDLVGDAVSLYGRGEASLEKDLNLVFHTIVGRNTLPVPVLKSLIGQASEQILRLRVLGTIDQPDIRREPLPMVGNVLEQLRVDLQPRPLSEPATTPKAAALRRQVK